MRGLQQTLKHTLVNMTMTVQEILTFNIHMVGFIYFLDIPVQNLINPKFMIKDCSLYIFLSNFKQCFIIKNLPEDFIKNIPFLNCYIKPKINLKSPTILITLN